jgi:hypothetical protein
MHNSVDLLGYKQVSNQICRLNVALNELHVDADPTLGTYFRYFMQINI